jgi:hypothetical protein
VTWYPADHLNSNESPEPFCSNDFREEGAALYSVLTYLKSEIEYWYIWACGECVDHHLNIRVKLAGTVGIVLMSGTQYLIIVVVWGACYALGNHNDCPSQWVYCVCSWGLSAKLLSAIGQQDWASRVVTRKWSSN